MTNEEKARKISINIARSYYSAYKGALEMAKWKDEQFIQILPEIFDFFVDNIGLYDGGCSNEDADKPWFIEEFTNKILGKK